MGGDDEREKTDDDKDLELDLMAEQELLRLTRQFRVMEGDKEAYVDEATKALRRQRKILDDLDKERLELDRSLKTARSGRRARLFRTFLIFSTQIEVQQQERRRERGQAGQTGRGAGGFAQRHSSGEEFSRRRGREGLRRGKANFASKASCRGQKQSFHSTATTTAATTTGTRGERTEVGREFEGEA